MYVHTYCMYCPTCLISTYCTLNVTLNGVHELGTELSIFIMLTKV